MHRREEEGDWTASSVSQICKTRQQLLAGRVLSAVFLVSAVNFSIPIVVDAVVADLLYPTISGTIGVLAVRQPVAVIVNAVAALLPARMLHRRETGTAVGVGVGESVAVIVGWAQFSQRRGCGSVVDAVNPSAGAAVDRIAVAVRIDADYGAVDRTGVSASTIRRSHRRCRWRSFPQRRVDGSVVVDAVNPSQELPLTE
jgi:hypothetical protein